MTFSNFLSLKTDVNEPTVSSRQKQRKKLMFCWFLESHGRKEQDPNPVFRSKDPDPELSQHVMDPEHAVGSQILYSSFFYCQALALI